jgi:hypothetical protein
MQVSAGAAGGRADGAVETGCAQAVEEAPIHPRAVEEPHGPAVAVWQDGFRSEFAGNGRTGASDFTQAPSSQPTALEAALAFRAGPPLWIEQAGPVNTRVPR